MYLTKEVLYYPAGHCHRVRGVSFRHGHGLHPGGNLQRGPRPPLGRGLRRDGLHRKLPSRPHHGRRHRPLPEVQNQPGQCGDADCR